MKNISKKVLAIVLAGLMALTISGCKAKFKADSTIEKAVNTVEGELSGKVVVLHSNDVHGKVEGYAFMKAEKKALEALGATVVTVDAGDFTNGSIYVSISKGASAVTLMNQVGYDVVGLGNHELDFGYDVLQQNAKELQAKVLCSNVTKDGKTIFDSNCVVKVGGLKIGFFALETPETQTKVNPNNVKGLHFADNDELWQTAQTQIDGLKKVADVVICIAHLGVDTESTGRRSTDLWAHVTGLDFVIDGHSHTVMEKGENNEPIQSTGTEFENVGAIVIDLASKKIEDNHLIENNNEVDADVLATAQNVINTVDSQFGAKFAETKVDLEGTKALVRSQETNLGDLICDSMIWSVTNETELEVAADHVVAVTNGGGIRASVATGDVTRSDIKSVLPFGNTIAVNYVTGAELLEALEASTFALPDTLGGFPQVAGMKIVIDCSQEFDQGEQYPDSEYFGPKSIKRVTITEVNGKAFSATDTYAVVTNNFCAAGGDTYYAFKRAYDAGKGFDTSIPMDEALVNYIQMALGNVIPETYAQPKNNIVIELAD